MSNLSTKVLSQSEYLDLFKQAVAFYDHGLKADAGKDVYVLVAKAVEQAQLPTYGYISDFYEIIISYHKSSSAFAENLLRYVWAGYLEAQR